MIKTKPRAVATPMPKSESKSNTIRIPMVKTKTPDQAMAELAAAGVLGNAKTMVAFAQPTYGELDLTESLNALRAQVDAVNRGDLSGSEAMLAAQATALNTIFGELARRAALNMGEHLGATETYIRLALKAQAQSRATLVALVEMKSPRPVAFVAQANVGQNVQVNNCGVAQPVRAGAHAHGKNQSEPTELLRVTHGEWMDSRTAGAAGASDTTLATVGAIHRAEDP